MEAIAWLVALGFFYFFAIAPGLKQWNQKISAANERLDSIVSQLSKIAGNEDSSLHGLHRKHDALVEALARIDDPKEMPHLRTHYDLILQLRTLRERKIPEEEIVKEHMNYRAPGSGRAGWNIPIHDKEKDKWTLWRFSPYFVATNTGVRLRQFSDLEQRAHEYVRASCPGEAWRSIGGFDKEQFPSAEEREVTVYYKDSVGKDREWPEPIAEAKA